MHSIAWAACICVGVHRMAAATCNMSIGHVEAYLGFSDAAYFSRFFSRQTGVPPRAFKLGA